MSNLLVMSKNCVTFKICVQIIKGHVRNRSTCSGITLTGRKHFHIIEEKSKYLQRTFFNKSSFGVKRKEYANRNLVGFSMDQMFSVVSDVESYHKFVPFCKRSIVLSNSCDHVKADLVIGFPPLVESYTSSVLLVRPHIVKAVCTEGKLFNYLETLWRFSPGLKSNPKSCIVDFSVSFEFRSLLHSQLAHVFFDKVVSQMEGAFIAEVRRRYGKESVQSHQLEVVRSQT